ncbi:hypothetical protein SKAU_G00285600 [Synaphobranchus kaupii]|uniref:S-phase kinase-associated protein 2 n=1 Tax=Synaphobranchus kaupii TaxID=118154 RepID=A0A9Q1EY59_SYNKA|nr:hypothetical protein SKAU_G00285600 [Synaphobranchus kaupii]
MAPLLNKGGRPQYIPWGSQDLQNLITTLPDIQEGAAIWIRKLEEEMTGKTMALGDVKALLTKVVGKEKMLDIIENAGYRGADKSTVDGRIFDQYRQKIWDSLRKAYPTRPSTAMLKGVPMKEEESAAAFVENQLRNWRMTLDKDIQGDPIMTAMFRAAILEGLPDLAKRRLEEVRQELPRERPLQKLIYLAENHEDSMLTVSQKGNPKKRASFWENVDTENTPQGLIQHWSPLHKHPCVTANGKENEVQFVLAKRPRRRKESTGLSWDSLPDELLLGIFACLPLQDLLGTSRVCKRWHRLTCDESLWHSVDLVGKAQVDVALGQVLPAGVVRLRCPRSCIGEPFLGNARCLRVQHMDLSSCTVSTPVLEDILSRCQQLRDLSLEGLVLSDSILQSLSQNTNLVRLNLCGCSGLSPQSLCQMLQCCRRLEELNVSWCDFDSSHVKAIVENIPSSVTQLNISGYRQNLTMEDMKALVAQCPDLTHLDLSDSVQVTTDSFQILQQLSSLKHLSLSRCYQIQPATLICLEKLPELKTLEVFGLAGETGPCGGCPAGWSLSPSLQARKEQKQDVVRLVYQGSDDHRWVH